MGEQFINIIFPPIFLLLWGKFCIQNYSTNLRLVALFFVSIVSFSQNFSFFYREIHQLIQLFILFLFFISIINNKRIKRISKYPLYFLVFILFSLLTSPFDSDAKAQFINFCVVLGMLSFLFNSIQSEKGLEKILKFIGELAVLSAFSGIVEYILGLSPRIEGTFANPNYFALFIGVGWSLVYCYFPNKSKYFFLTIMTLVIILSGSRAALVFPILFMFWRIIMQKSKLKTFLYGSAAFCFITIVFLSGATRFSNPNVSGSDAERIVFAKIAINMAIDNPLSGVGWGRFISEFSNYSSSVDKIILDNGVIDASKQDRRVTHNDLLRIMAELGLIALFLVLVFLWKTVVLLYKHKGFNLDYLFPCWVGILLFSLSHNNLNTAYSWFFLLLPWFVFYQRKCSTFK